MKTLCLALFLSQHSPKEALPPEHIQDLVKKRILYQHQQAAPQAKLHFDKDECQNIGSYTYMDEEVLLHSNDNSMELRYSFVDLIEGRKLEVSPLVSLTNTHANKKLDLEPNAQTIIQSTLLERHTSLESPKESESSYNYKKWLPYVVGAVGLSLGGWALYNSTQRGRGGGGTGEQGLGGRGRP
jgi:hypothetical protein